MTGNGDVLHLLNQGLQGEHFSHNFYTVNAARYKWWGLKRLAKHENHEALDERRHARLLMDRILLLGGQPRYDRVDLFPDTPDVPSTLAANLAAELQGRLVYIELIAVAAQVKDFGTRDLIQTILSDEEDHIRYLETQQRLLTSLGLDNYLALYA
jgi:bacterioferritin